MAVGGGDDAEANPGSLQAQLVAQKTGLCKGKATKRTLESTRIRNLLVENDPGKHRPL